MPDSNQINFSDLQPGAAFAIDYRMHQGRVFRVKERDDSVAYALSVESDRGDEMYMSETNFKVYLPHTRLLPLEAFQPISTNRSRIISTRRSK